MKAYTDVSSSELQVAHKGSRAAAAASCSVENNTLVHTVLGHLHVVEAQRHGLGGRPVDARHRRLDIDTGGVKHKVADLVVQVDGRGERRSGGRGERVEEIEAGEVLVGLEDGPVQRVADELSEDVAVERARDLVCARGEVDEGWLESLCGRISWAASPEAASAS